MDGQKEYKVKFLPAIPRETIFKREYETLEQAVTALNAIAEYTLLLHETNPMADYSDIGILFKKTSTGWVEIGDDGVEIL